MLLNLPSITVIKTDEIGEHNYHVYAAANTEATQCPECGNSDPYGHGAKEQLFMDTPIHGRRVGILLTRKRYRCRQCKVTFFQACNDIHGSHRATKRLVSYIEKTAIITTCVSVAHEVGLSEGLIRSILKKYTFETPVN